MRRAVLIAVGAVVFVVIAGLLARYLQTESGERSKIHALLVAQARGDAAGMLDRLDPSCRSDARCRRTVQDDAERLARPGEPKILNLDSGTAYALGSKTGVTRVAWTVIGRGNPVVQCVTVRRSGNALAGRRVSLLAVSAPIANQASC